MAQDTYPTEKLDFYDLPEDIGDEGWDDEILTESVRLNGIQAPLEIGYSLYDWIVHGTLQPCVFNGNHRLRIARDLGLEEVPVVASDADDAWWPPTHGPLPRRDDPEYAWVRTP